MKRGAFWLFLGALVLGLTLTTLLRTRAPYPDQGQGARAMADELAREKSLLEERVALEDQAARVDARIAAYEKEIADADENVSELMREARDTQHAAGYTDLTGQGVEITLRDAPRSAYHADAPISLSIVHDADVLRVINALRAAGAEAISINDVRVTGSTRIRCGGPTIHIKDTPLAPPFVIRAIGNPFALESAMTGDEGDSISLYRELTLFGVQCEVKRSDAVLVKRSLEPQRFRVARIGEE